MNVTHELATNRMAVPKRFEKHPEAHVDPLPRPLQPVPAVVPEVDREGLGEEQHGVDPVGREEDGRHVRPKLRVVADEEEQQQRAEEGGGGEGGERELDQLVREPVVLLVPRAPADDLDDDGEDRHAEDERGEIQVQLGDRPHREAGADPRKTTVRRLLRRFLCERGQGARKNDDASENETGCGYLRDRPSRERWRTLSDSVCRPRAETGGHACYQSHMDVSTSFYG
jgi:hypothetical protein